MKILKRHLGTHYNMSPDEYRKRWNLPIDYPIKNRHSRLFLRKAVGSRKAPT